ncbi:hypothetical protein BN2476_80127 [Paraburkholderia piptadeniae]|uniref:Uncharacterized protein n=1 Tax=Paraburkholderia piptadeniae TaxID=1701573 RepID=A0A1N7RM86_9BURK|nr:hypothetical protein BN2476_80127 [Paraburkholderia piptadeniae]
MHSATPRAAAVAAVQCATHGWDVRPTSGIKENPLPGCLLEVTRLFARPTRAEALVAALPLIDRRLTPEMLIRAAARMNISVRPGMHALGFISDLVLHAVLTESVLVDGVELRQWNPAAHRRGIGHVAQDAVIQRQSHGLHRAWCAQRGRCCRTARCEALAGGQRPAVAIS